MTVGEWISLIAVVLSAFTLWSQQRKNTEDLSVRLARLEEQNDARAEATHEFRVSLEKRLDHIDGRVTQLEKSRA